MKFGIYIKVDEWCMTVCRMTRFKVKVKVTRLLKFRKLHFSKSIKVIQLCPFLIFLDLCMKTSSQSNLTKRPHYAAHGRFNHIRQVAPMWTHSHLGFVIPQMASWSVQPFCTAHGRESLYFTMGHFFALRIVPSHGWIWTLFNTWFLVPPESTIQTASWLAQPFLHSWRQRVPILCNGLPLSPSDQQTDRQTTLFHLQQ